MGGWGVRLGVRIQKGDEGVRRGGGEGGGGRVHSQTIWIHCFGETTGGVGGGGRAGGRGDGGGEGSCPRLRPVNHWGPTRQPLEGQREDMRPAEDL